MRKKAKSQKPGCSRRLDFLPIIFIVLMAMKLTAAVELDICRCEYSGQLFHSIFVAFGIPALVK